MQYCCGLDGRHKFLVQMSYADIWMGLVVAQLELHSVTDGAPAKMQPRGDAMGAEVVAATRDVMDPDKDLK